MNLPDFTANPEKVRAVVEAERLQYGHLINPTFAIEISKIEPLPHQRLAVYEHMLQQPRLRFLLADDAGAGKTIMTGLYIREMLARRLIQRILIVPPAGLVDNWQNELATLFSLHFSLVSGIDAKKGNPFIGPGSDRLIVSMDTLRQKGMFTRLQEAEVKPYDLVVFDEAHKLSANQEADFTTVRKTDRYKLAEALAGANMDDPPSEWRLNWASRHLLLLTATPHMGKDLPYYYLWRLLKPDMLSTYEAYQALPAKVRQNYFIRRTKEEMVYYDGRTIYPQRLSNTFSYELTNGAVSEQTLYDETTFYIDEYYNKAPLLNRAAARFVISMFQRRLASSTYALRCSFERRLGKLERFIAKVEAGELNLQQSGVKQAQLKWEDTFENKTADEEVMENEQEENERVEEEALDAVMAQSLEQLKAELDEVRKLLKLADEVLSSKQREDSKFIRLRGILDDPEYQAEKLIIFTEHRDTLTFLVQRLEAIGLVDKIAFIHGGLNYRQRAEQVAFFRREVAEGGARLLIATDAAGEGINLQFCWLMVNYDIPWNPARLEQRMGRIHRFGQKKDPVIIMNLVAGKTREGKVLEVLLTKLEHIREQLGSDKVFDVVGKLFEGKSIRDYISDALTDRGAMAAAQEIERTLSLNQVQRLVKAEQAQYGQAQGEVRQALSRLRENRQQELYRKLMPGYVAGFMKKVLPLLNLKFKGDLQTVFTLHPQPPKMSHPLLEAMGYGQPELQFTVQRPNPQDKVIFLHPGEPNYELFSDYVHEQFAAEALQGGCFVDPTALEPYLFHVLRLTVERAADETHAIYRQTEQVEVRLIGLKQSFNGEVQPCPMEHLLLLKADVATKVSPMGLAELIAQSEAYAQMQIILPLLEVHRQRIQATIAERRELITDGFEIEKIELTKARQKQNERKQKDYQSAQAQITRINKSQRSLDIRQKLAIQAIELEPNLLKVGEVAFIAHALVYPTRDPEIQEQYNQQIEQAAMQTVWAYEMARGATVIDVTTPDKARAAGLTDHPGFDVLSHCNGVTRCIEVKGRAQIGKVELTENEWSQACTLRERYWLYVVYNCALLYPNAPLRIQDPFGRQIRSGVVFHEQEILTAARETEDD